MALDAKDKRRRAPRYGLDLEEPTVPAGGPAFVEVRDSAGRVGFVPEVPVAAEAPAETNVGMRTAPTDLSFLEVPAKTAAGVAALGGGAAVGARLAPRVTLPAVPRPSFGSLPRPSWSAPADMVRGAGNAARAVGRANPAYRSGVMFRSAGADFLSGMANMAGHQTVPTSSGGAFVAGLRPSTYANPSALAGAPGWAGRAAAIPGAGRAATAARWGVGTGLVPGLVAGLGGEIVGNFAERTIGDRGPAAFGGAVDTGSLVDDAISGAGTGFAFGGPLGAAVGAVANPVGSVGGNALRSALGWAPTDENALEIVGRGVGNVVGGVGDAVGGLLGRPAGGQTAENSGGGEVVVPVYGLDTVGGAYHQAFTGQGMAGVPPQVVADLERQWTAAEQEALTRVQLGYDAFATNDDGTPIPADQVQGQKSPTDPAQIRSAIATEMMLTAPAAAQQWTAQQQEEQRRLGQAAAWQQMLGDVFAGNAQDLPDSGQMAWDTTQRLLSSLPSVYQPVAEDWANRYRAEHAASQLAYQRQMQGVPTLAMYEQLMAEQEARARLEEELAAAQAAPPLDMAALGG